MKKPDDAEYEDAYMKDSINDIGVFHSMYIVNKGVGNAFASNVPSSLANLKNLEALDLSRNQLSGQIPRELGRLSFLSAINFSHNHLEGPVPRSTQFQSQPCSSFVDNPKLTGLEEICGENRVPVPISQESKELLKGEEKVVNWIAAAIAFGPGVFCGW
ncbi:receptor-like protein 30 [Brassica napus]|uniref:receptor-like protein 30 n=1 Tax=Brassica napus TaxID=3708 RepID=UPI0006AB6C2F|nr:receptor-like protein 30 [Brassica napus]